MIENIDELIILILLSNTYNGVKNSIEVNYRSNHTSNELTFVIKDLKQKHYLDYKSFITRMGRKSLQNCAPKLIVELYDSILNVYHIPISNSLSFLNVHYNNLIPNLVKILSKECCSELLHFLDNKSYPLLYDLVIKRIHYFELIESDDFAALLIHFYFRCWHEYNRSADIMFMNRLSPNSKRAFTKVLKDIGYIDYYKYPTNKLMRKVESFDPVFIFYTLLDLEYNDVASLWLVLHRLPIVNYTTLLTHECKTVRGISKKIVEKFYFKDKLED